MTVAFELPAVVVKDVLSQRISDVPTYIDTPRTPGDKYLRVVSQGGSRSGHGQLSSRVIQVLAYAKTSGLAAQLCERAVAAVCGAGLDPAEKRIRSCSIAAEPADYADPDTGAPRATATVVVLMRGATTS